MGATRRPHPALRPAAAARWSAAAGARMARHGDELRALLQSLYGTRPDFDAWCARLLARVAAVQRRRDPQLQALDDRRERQPDWLCDRALVGYSAYVERFAGNLRALTQRLDALQELGVRVLHLLPFLAARRGDNDGGFAVSDFGHVEPRLGSNRDLAALCAQLRARGMSLMADAVLNHVADDHPWARAARAGDRTCQERFLWLDSAAEVAARERELDQVFPDQAPGNFTAVPALGRWAWTTFLPYQWDLNWANPQVFEDMVLAVLRLANLGVEIFRVDAASCLWKAAGTNCRDLPQVHLVLRAIRCVLRIAAPAVALNAEAMFDAGIVHRYFGHADEAPQECSMAYDAGLMAAAWMSLALEETSALRVVLGARRRPPFGCTWLTYVRCHDDLLWDVLRGDLERAGLDAHAMMARAAQRLDSPPAGGFAHGLPSQPCNAPFRGTSGMTAELVGLATARDADQQRLALARYTLLYGLVYLVDGLPVIYSGDEIAQRNAANPLPRADGDTRWLHRPHLDLASLEQARHGRGRGAQAFALLATLARARAGGRPRAPLALVDGLPRELLGLACDEHAALFNFAQHEVVLPTPPAALARLAAPRGAPLVVPPLGLLGWPAA